MDDQKIKPIFEQMHFIEQFAESVMDYTSRYNNAMGVSYAPENIIGKPTKYPCYGDFPETYMLVMFSLIRIDFNQSMSEYHTAIDAVLLAGYKPKTPLQANLIRNGLMEIKRPTHRKKICHTSEEEEKDSSLFLTLPLEVIVYIFGFLDLRSLCNCALVNRTFRTASNDSLLYRDLSFKRYWYRVSDRTLQHFEPRCKLLHKLDLSWCGGGDRITEEGFIRFLKNCGSHLTHLSLGKCEFVQVKGLEMINKCRELTDLRLRNCWLSSPDNFLVLSELTALKSLDLYCSNVDDQSLLKIIKNNRGLLHLNIDLCENLLELDLITETLSLYNRRLRTFSSWKTHSLTTEGIKSLSKLSELRELDLGWCLVLSDAGDCLTYIAQECPHIVRLIVSGWRGLADHQLLPIVRYCVKIQQLDLLGTRGITGDICERALRTFHDLRLLDVSFCEGVTLRQVDNWRQEYPNVKIQRSCREYRI